MFLIFLAVFIILVLLVILAAVTLRHRRRARRRLIDPGRGEARTIRIEIRGDPDRWIDELARMVARKAADTADTAPGDDHLKEPRC